MNEETTHHCIRFWSERSGDDEQWLEFEVGAMGCCGLHFGGMGQSLRVPLSPGDLRCLSSGRGVRADGPNAACDIERIGPEFVIKVSADNGFSKEVRVGLGLMFIALRNIVRMNVDEAPQG